MRRAFLAIAASAATFAAAAAEGDGFNTDFFGGWRFTAGGAMNANIRSKLRLRQGHVGQAGLARTESQGRGDAYRIGEGRVNFPNGGFIDPNSSAAASGGTWNWHLPAGALDAGGTYSIVDYYSGLSGLDCGTKDDDYAAGFSFGLDREIGRWGDAGVDFGTVFSFFRKSDMVKAGGFSSNSSGSYVTDVSFNPDIIFDPWAQNPDGSYGAGTFDGPGPVLDLDGGDVSVSHRWANESTLSSPLRMRGDYEELEMIFALKPWYDLTDWFRVQATLGAAVSRAHLKFGVSGTSPSTSHQRFDEWSVYGVGGLGGMFRFEDFCLGFDFIARFLDNAMKIDGRDVHGTIDRGGWFFRVYVGYEF